MVYYAAVKNEEDFCELIMSNFQNILLSEKGKAQKNICSMLPFMLEPKIYKKVYRYPLTCVKKKK